VILPKAGIRTVVVPLDGSAVAEQSLPIATLIARRCDARVVLIRVHEPPRLAMAHANDWDREIRQREHEYLCAIAAATSAGERSVELFLLDGHPADAICKFAVEREFPLVVMASHGRTGASRFWIGSVADAVLGLSHVPVLMVRASSERKPASDTIQRILVPLDGSVMSEQILPFATTIADAMGARIQLVHVVDPADVPPTAPSLAEDALAALVRVRDAELRALASKLCRAHPRLSVSVSVRVNDSAASAIVSAASANACDMVAMTAWSQGLRRVLLGSVADKVVRAGPAFILLIRPRSRAIEAHAHRGQSSLRDTVDVG
jgi:nucleotide-binding universal stress UspA family protein